MKKPFNILLATTFALPLFMACETDTDSNPVLNEPDTFTLNTPAYAANNVYDLKNAKSVELTCCQPDYGFPAATTYKVHASFDQEFTEATEEAKANYTELETIHSTARMNVNASELNNALLDLWTAVNGEQAELPAQPIAVYIRLKANISGSNKGECVSNVIGLPNVLISKSTGSLAPPKTMFIVGSMLDAAWKVWKPMAGVYGMDGQFYSMIYFDANSEFKFGTKENEYIGTKDGNFVSPAMTASGEVRMCFKTDLDWWRTEFTLHDGEIFYRDFNLINSWTEKGDGYAIQGAAGDVIELNFTAGTGEKK